MQGESSLVFSQGGSPQCAVSCFPSEVRPKALLQQFLTLYYKGIFRAFAIQWMRWRLLASSGPKARPEDYKPAEQNAQTSCFQCWTESNLPCLLPCGWAEDLFLVFLCLGISEAAT